MAKRKLLKGNSQDVISANIQMLKDNGYSHSRATRCALCHANKRHSHDAKRIKSAMKEHNSQVVIKGGTPSDPTDLGYDDLN